MRSAVTGERVVTSRGGFNPSWQRHVAGYLLSAPYLPQGRVLDVGCGVGHSFEALAPRETVGVDVDPTVLDTQERETVVADMRALPFASASFDGALAVHSIEHVPDPERALREIERVLKPGGTAVLVTPNRLTFARPDEIIDPYHYVEYDARELEAVCAAVFEGVQVAGLFGSERHRAFVAREHAKLDRLLGVDPLRLRRLVPRTIRQRLYDWRLTSERAEHDPEAAAITPDDFTLGTDGVDAAFDLVALCRISQE